MTQAAETGATPYPVGRWRRWTLRRQGRLDGRKRDPDPLLLAAPVATGMRRLLLRQLDETWTAAHEAFTQESARQLRRVSELCAEYTRLRVELADAERDLVSVEAQRPDPAAPPERRQGERHQREAVVRARRNRDHHRLAIGPRQRQQQVRTVLPGLTREHARLRAEVEDLYRQAVDRAWRLRASFLRDQAIYDQALLRRHPEGDSGQPTAAPTVTGGEPVRRRRRRDDSGLAGSRLEQPAMILVLVVMALADAYQFWYALQEIIQRDTLFVALFVLGVMTGAVAAAHYVGRLARSRREAYGGSIAWIALVTLLWLGIGGVVAWIRLTHVASSSFAGGSGASGYLTEGVGASGADPRSLQLAVLLLALYLLTGAVAMTHAYRFGDPRSAEVRRTLRERRRYANEVARLAHLHRLAEGDWQARSAERQRDQEQHDRAQETHDAGGDGHRAEARQWMAEHQGNPQATDALTLGDHETATTEGNV